MPWLAPTLMAVGFALSVPCTWLAMRWGLRQGALDSPGASGHVKVLRAVPNTGGIGLVAAWALPMLAALAALQWWPQSVPTGGPTSERVSAALGVNWAIVAAALWLHVAGCVDDRRALGAVPKLLTQLVPAVALAWWADLRPLTLLDAHGPAGHALSVGLGVAWLLLLVNAMNYLDNMDGLSAGVGVVACLLFACALQLVRQWFVAAQFSLLAGSLLGFLMFNFVPRGGARVDRDAVDKHLTPLEPLGRALARAGVGARGKPLVETQAGVDLRNQKIPHGRDHDIPSGCRVRQRGGRRVTRQRPSTDRSRAEKVVLNSPAIVVSTRRPVKVVVAQHPRSGSQ